MVRKKIPNDQTQIAKITYTELNLAQCQSIIDNYKIIQARIVKEKPKLNEEIYHDFSVSNDLFISYRKAKGYSDYHLDFWIHGERYSLSTNTIIQKLEKFMEY